MVWMLPPDGIAMCQDGAAEVTREGGGIHGGVSIVGVDLAKHVFQVHGAAADGRVLFRKKLSRAQFARFMGDVHPCIVVMDAWGRSH